MISTKLDPGRIAEGGSLVCFLPSFEIRGDAAMPIRQPGISATKARLRRDHIHCWAGEFGKAPDVKAI